jgi:hypothetical protein
MEPESKKYRLNIEDAHKILTGLLVAMAGAGITYAVDTVGMMDFGEYTPFVVAVASVLVNIARKFLAGYRA